jgi:hypothetical protein
VNTESIDYGLVQLRQILLYIHSPFFSSTHSVIFESSSCSSSTSLDDKAGYQPSFVREVFASLIPPSSPVVGLVNLISRRAHTCPQCCSRGPETCLRRTPQGQDPAKRRVIWREGGRLLCVPSALADARGCRCHAATPDDEGGVKTLTISRVSGLGTGRLVCQNADAPRGMSA